MQKYNLQGFYLYNGAKSELTGELVVSLSGTVQGDIIDYGSRFPKQKIFGKIEEKDKMTELSFFKFPDQAHLANLLYSLRKNYIDEDYSGDYRGKWMALPKIDMDDAFHADLDGKSGLTSFIRVLIPQHTIEEITEITLKAK